ncbi:MAG: heme-binding protein [Pseudomonadota bacterium]
MQSLIALSFQLAVLTLSDASAQSMVEGCMAYAAENELTVAVAVVDRKTDLAAYRRMDRLRAGPAKLAMEKADYAARWGSPTQNLRKSVNDGSLAWALGSRGVPVGGGVPVYGKDGDLLGAIGVSGASQEQDIACAEAGIAKAGLKATRP